MTEVKKIKQSILSPDLRAMKGNTVGGILEEYGYQWMVRNILEVDLDNDVIVLDTHLLAIDVDDICKDAHIEDVWYPDKAKLKIMTDDGSPEGIDGEDVYITFTLRLLELTNRYCGYALHYGQKGQPPKYTQKEIYEVRTHFAARKRRRICIYEIDTDQTKIEIGS